MNVIPFLITACVELACDNVEDVVKAERISAEDVGNYYGSDSIKINVSDRSYGIENYGKRLKNVEYKG